MVTTSYMWIDHSEQDNSQCLDCTSGVGPQDPNHSESNMSKKDPNQGVTFSSQLAYSVILL